MEMASMQVEPMQSIEQVIDAMEMKLKIFQRNRDHRVVFHHVYLLMTKEMQKRLTSNFFLDSVWMERVLVGFAHYYFNAMDAYEKGIHCPPAWELAFRMATEKQSLVLQDALMGINAHINSDLPLVMYEILKEDGAWPDARIMLRRHQDHDRINDILRDLIDLVQDELAQHYGRLIRILDFIMGRKDESLFAFILAHCRTNVWHNTELLLDAADEKQRSLQQHLIENDAYMVGLKIAHTHSFKFTKYFASFFRKNRLF